MSERVKPLDVYRLLPGTNCKECGYDSCMAFAYKLIQREAKLEQCKPLFTDPKYESARKKLEELLTPPVRPVVIGVGDNAVTIGGEEVMYRHELTFYNPTVFAIDVHDEMPEDELIARVKRISEFKIERVGQVYRLDAIAVRCTSGNPAKFAECVRKVVENSQLPLILCSLDPKVLEAGLEVAKERKPLIYAATKDNWKEVGKLAQKYNVPVVVSAPGDISTLKSIVRAFMKAGIKEIVLDPGTFFGEGQLADTLDIFTMIRRAAIEKGDKELGWPLLGIPAVVWAGKDGASLSEAEKIELAFMESILCSMLIERFADILIIHTLDTWSLLAPLTLRQDIYTDPRIHPAVEPGLKKLGNPNEWSPVLVTCNFAITYHLVRNDVEGKADAWLLVVDTGGINVESAVAGGTMTADSIAEAMKEAGLEKVVKHRAIIIPGLAARLKGELEDATGWDVHVGPRDSAGIPEFLRKSYWVREGVYGVKSPSENAPVVLTSSNIKEHYSLRVPLAEANVSAWIVVLGTKGKTLEEAIKDGEVSGDAVAQCLDRTGIANLVKHRKLIVSEDLKDLASDIASKTGWEVAVGPKEPEKMVDFVKNFKI
ncbi:MAG: acetyl-CoA decarbonylase/synthase complex subunit gamma [Candidatus Baldrarchaeia archaeon]